MLALLTAAGLIFVAAITPGPNNVIVMGAASRGGLRAALPAIAGVAAGSLLLLAVAAVGASALILSDPRGHAVLALLGAAYLAWAGGTMIIGAGRQASGPGRVLPEGFGATAAFQFANPKAWLLTLGAAAAAGSGDGAGAEGPARWIALAVIMVGVTVPCLLLWAVAGSALAPWIAEPKRRRAFDRIMGAMLAASGLLLLLGH